VPHANSVREEFILPTWCLRIAWQAFVALSFAALLSAAPAHAADPIKVGVSLALTGGVAANGKQILMAPEFWRDDVNAKGDVGEWEELWVSLTRTHLMAAASSSPA
jgi:hypothetical protein